MFKRIKAVIKRYMLLYLNNPARAFDLFFWPFMELFVWGFMSLHVDSISSVKGGFFIYHIITALIFWDVLYRSQQAVSLSFMEELWTRNVLNLFISPLKTMEWVVAVYLFGLIKTGFITLMLIIAASVAYQYDINSLGFYFIPLSISLLLMGWSFGLFTCGLLIIWGHAAETLIWGVPFLIQPFSAIFYPLSVYPDWLKPFCLLIPSTHIMESMRQVIETGTMDYGKLFISLILNVMIFLFCTWFFKMALEKGRKNGRLVRMIE